MYVARIFGSFAVADTLSEAFKELQALQGVLIDPDEAQYFKLLPIAVNVKITFEEV